MSDESDSGLVGPVAGLPVLTINDLKDRIAKRQSLARFDFDGMDLADSHVSLEKQTLDGSNLSRVKLQRVKLKGASLRDVCLKRAECLGANFSGADLRGADLTTADLQHAKLDEADLRGCTTRELKLNNASTKKTHFDRRALRMLGKDFGGLTPADLADLVVDDDQVKLSVNYGGIRSLIHVTSVLVFLTPYVIFGIGRYVASLSMSCAEGVDCTTLRNALWNFVWTGGRSDGIDVIGMLVFMLLIAYSVFRVSLVLKSQELDMTERAAGIPRQFVMSGYWLLAYQACRALVIVNLALVVVHSYHLMAILVPVAH